MSSDYVTNAAGWRAHGLRHGLLPHTGLSSIEVLEGSPVSHHRVLVFVALLSTSAAAQWLNYAPPGTPRGPDGKPDLSAPVPRTAEGKPDLSGVWMHETTSVAEVKRLFGNRFDEAIQTGGLGMEIGTQHKYEFDILLDFKPGQSPMKPAAEESMRRYAADRRAGNDVCVGIPGIPRADLLSEPIKIVQAPRMTIILYESGNSHRQIYTDGRTLPKEFNLPAFLGYSVGHWEDNTFIVETAGFNDKTVLDRMGHPHGESLHVIERYRRRDFGHMDIETTIDDPQFYTRPFTIKVPHTLLADSDIFEAFCTENEKDRAHLGR